ncbi:DUF4142 domain-containing protein [Pontibacter sp. H249]|uniref:DUF4142 domain-containing protein n=1 Tax=Pontibacter sp. H249 TaxID=3133420 RepID=UPI0030C26E38
MKKYLMGILCLALLSGMYACGDTSNTDQTTTITEAGSAADSVLTDDRRELLAYTARHMMLQKELASMAQQKAQTDSLKLYAQRLNEWATTKQNELKDLEQQYNFTLSQQLSDDERDYLDDPQEADANEFDEELWEEMVKSQKDAIKHIDNNIKDMEETDASAFAIWERNTLKELRAYMEQAAAYELELENRSDQRGGISKPIVEEINN